MARPAAIKNSDIKIGDKFHMLNAHYTSQET